MPDKIKRGWDFSPEFCRQLEGLATEYPRPVTQAAIIEAAVALLAALPKTAQQEVLVAGLLSGRSMNDALPKVVAQLAGSK